MNNTIKNVVADQVVDAAGLACPLPLLKLKLALKSLNSDQVVKLIATDAGSKTDVPSFCELSDNELIQFVESDNIYYFWVKHG